MISFGNIFSSLLRESNLYREENNIINQLYPNPDEMTYEQLLELQEKIGFVSKGISKEDKDVFIFRLFFNFCYFLIFRKFLIKYLIRKMLGVIKAQIVHFVYVIMRIKKN